MRALTRLLLFVVGIALVGFGVKNGVDAIQTGLQGATTTGRVVTLDQANGAYRVSYEITVNGRTYTGAQDVSSDQYAKLQVGGPIPIRSSPM